MKANLVIEPPGHRAAKVKVLGLLIEIVNLFKFLPCRAAKETRSLFIHHARSLGCGQSKRNLEQLGFPARQIWL